MLVIKSLKIKQADGTFGEAINLGAKAENISIEGEGSSLDLQKFLRTRPVKYYGSFSDAIFEAQFIPKEEALNLDKADLYYYNNLHKVLRQHQNFHQK